MVERLRDVDSSFDEVLVGGRAAELVDSKAGHLQPGADRRGSWIAVTTFVLLFLSFGSLLVPLKAIVLNVLSLTATFGAMVWIFQEGNGAGVLDFTATGTLDTTMPILMFCIAFGLSMDYEVFLLSPDQGGARPHRRQRPSRSPSASSAPAASSPPPRPCSR